MFQTIDGKQIHAVDESQMREVDRIAVEEFGLSILQMMENAGRNLALLTINLFPKSSKSNHNKVFIFAGSGGNGGGGISSARHLYNHNQQVFLILSKDQNKITGSARSQLEILKHTNIEIINAQQVGDIITDEDIIIDALIGYSLQGAPRGLVAEQINLINQFPAKIISLDIPSGIDSTDGKTPGVYVTADQTLTLALPKPGLLNPAAGELHLGDIGIPPEVYIKLGLKIKPLFETKYNIRLIRVE